MRIAGLPVWALVLVACAVAPFLIQLWIDAEQRRAKERTRALLRPFFATSAEGDLVSGTGRAASIDEGHSQSPPRSSPEQDERDDPTTRDDE
jgi:hypothetical protein